MICVCVMSLVTADLSAAVRALSVQKWSNEETPTLRPATWTGFVWTTTGSQLEFTKEKGLVSGRLEDCH